MPQKYIAKGKSKGRDVWLTFTPEGGGWNQWSDRRVDATLFDTEEQALANAASASGPWFNVPMKASIRAELTDIEPIICGYRPVA